MTTQEFEAAFWQLLPYALTAIIAAVSVLILTRRKKDPAVCPLPSEVILEELQLLLAEIFKKSSSKDAFLREAAKLWDTKATLSRK